MIGTKPPSVSMSDAPCAYCHGAGFFKSQTSEERLKCPKCNGTGRAPKLDKK